MTQSSQNSRLANLINNRFLRRTPNSFILATIVSGFTFFFTQQQINQFNSRQAQLITRVQNEETADKFKTDFNHYKLQDWNCKKVNLDGVLKEGRFVVKRVRGKQEGYMVLAPFVVQTSNNEVNINENYNKHNANRKFILNLGWIPKSRKHLVFATIPENLLGEEVYEDRLQAIQKEKQDGLIRDPLFPEITVPISNVTAYIRTGEQQDRRNGRINWIQNYLYKWIDLKLLTRVFRVHNEDQAQTIYLERSMKTADQPESFPLSATKQTVIADLKTQSKHFEKNANSVFGLTALASFGIAFWSTFL